MTTNTIKPLVLVILDGWGYRTATEHNAIAAAITPTWDALWADCPHGVIEGSGRCVGLPAGQMGNSEVGHLHLGAGRLVPQELTRINMAIENGEFFTNPVLLQAITLAKQRHGALHVLGLLSPGGVHSHENHIHALIKMAAANHLERLYLHAFLDGRDTPPQSALASIAATEKCFEDNGCGQFASVIGRYYAMDRDNRWERVQLAYNLITQGIAAHVASDATDALAMAYARKETDEFVAPTAIVAPNGGAITVEDNDVVIFMNFRADRARALTNAFTDANFTGFTRLRTPQLSAFVSLTPYAEGEHTLAAYTPVSTKNGLGETLSLLNKRQLRIAETEKYAHVTFFFNGGRETPFPGEDRQLIPSPKVATYDLQPEMSAPLLTQSLIAAIHQGIYDVIICNYANPDMVGHTGNFNATVSAIETIDQCLAELLTALNAVGGALIITADHGNAECLYDEATGQPHTAHTTEPVPIIYTGGGVRFIDNKGTLANVAPSLLYLLKLPIPAEMTASPLFEWLPSHPSDQ